MNSPLETGTRASLLYRLRHNANDPGSWKEFVERYGPKVYRWCRSWHLQEADAQDVTQQVLLQLATKLREFNYDPAKSFRAWLKTLTRYALCDFQNSKERSGMVCDNAEDLQRLQTVEARQDLETRLADEYDQEVKEEAMARVQLRVERHTWNAFQLRVCEELPAEEVARRVGMKVAMVHVAKSKVLKMIREEVRKLQGEEEDP